MNKTVRVRHERADGTVIFYVIHRADPQQDGEAMRTEESFSSAEVCDVVGITYRQIDYWAALSGLRVRRARVFVP